MPDFSYQLYSSRNFPPLSDTLKMLSALGYSAVEGYGGQMGSPAAVAQLAGDLETAGLAMPTAHVGFDMVRDQPGDVIALARKMRIGTIFVPHIGLGGSDAATWAAFGRDLAEAGKPLMDAGLSFGWHNHDFEFADLGGEDRPIDLILAGSDDLRFEMDVAWIARAGQDPLPWITKYADRIDAVHVKDIAPEGECTDEDGWADVGHGVMDWPGIMEALKSTSARHFVMEHDNPSDDRRFAERSIAAAKAF